MVGAASGIGNRCDVEEDNAHAMFAQKVHEFLPMEGCQATAHKDEEVVQGQVVKAVVEEVFCKQAPG